MGRLRQVGSSSRGWLLRRQTILFRGVEELLACMEGLLNDPGVLAIEMDLSKVEHMDPTSLGMLLVLREKAELKGKAVVLFRPAACVTAILESVHFGKLFRIVG